MKKDKDIKLKFEPFEKFLKKLYRTGIGIERAMSDEKIKMVAALFPP